MRFLLSEAQSAIQDSVRRFCRDKYSLRARAAILKTSEGFSRQNWSTFAKLGWLGAALPSDVGGIDGTALENGLILEEFGRALVLEPFWATAVWAGQLINVAADQDQRSSLLRPLAAGTMLFSVAHNEAGSNDVLEHVETSAIETKTGGFVLNGRKQLVVAGASSDKLLVSARTSEAARNKRGISLFVVDRAASGLTVRDYRLIDGTHACDVTLNNVHVSSNDLLGEKDAGWAPLAYAMDHAMVGLCAETVGIMDSALYITRDYMRMRRQYKVLLSSLQALQHRMAEMFLELELSRSSYFRALSHFDHAAESRHKQVLACLIHTSRSAKFVCKNSIQLHGGMGMTAENIVGNYFKRTMVISSLFGGVDGLIERYVSSSSQYPA